ncbi:MAG: septal ring lytic transglycosylase RlpA family protein [Actinobacteria bacterium]|nr:septal ring lytic transglycosylase RlpA family protein [Actinomycetota bacterium]
MLPRFLITTILLTLFLVSCVPRARFQNADLNSETDLSSPKENTVTTHRTRKFEYYERGIASFTADENQGKRTASGEIYNMRDMVAAHKRLPFGTLVKVKNLKNGKTVVVRINDRGPYVRGRIIDLSFEAAKKLDFVEEGTTEVEVEIVKMGR